MKGILGRKLGMTQVFSESAVLIPVTVIEATPNVVLQQKTHERDQYQATQVGFEEKKATRVISAERGHASKANTGVKKFVREFQDADLSALSLGAEIKVDIFSSGEFVDVQAISKGKGFTGNIKRNNQHLGPASHGSGFHRGIGSLATNGRNNGIVNKGRVMPGRHGFRKTTIQNLEVIHVDVDKNVILVKGSVPGPKGALVIVKENVKQKASKVAEKLHKLSQEETANA